jgi:protein-S-isoprenylcysteine O-methyltransferase Ste14
MPNVLQPLIRSENLILYLYAALWTIFIIIGTLFEEAGLNQSDEFGKSYAKYASQVSAFIPRLGYFTGKKIQL